MTNTAVSRRRARGIHPKPANVQQKPRGKRSALPEYLEAHEVRALIAAAPHARAKLLILLQWRASTWVCLETGEVEVMELAGDLSVLAGIQPPESTLGGSSSWTNLRKQSGN